MSSNALKLSSLQLFVPSMPTKILRSKLTDELLPIAVRQQIVEKLLEGKGHRLTAQFVSLVLGAGKGRDLRAIAAAISENVAGSSGRKVAEVRSAVELSEDQQKRLADALGKKFNTQVNLKVVVDPTVVGGIVATVGDEVIDASSPQQARPAQEPVVKNISRKEGRHGRHHILRQ